LSLFGYNPARDFDALTRGAQGRRVNPLNPDRSLLLLKATGQAPHEGGPRFTPESWEYRVIRAWIAAGAQRDPAQPALEALALRPSALTLEHPSATGRLAVVARFADGAESDVTSFSELRARDADVAGVASTGVIQGLRPGDTAVVASFSGVVAAARVLVSTGRPVTIPEKETKGLVDRHVSAKLRALGIAPSGAASDAEFLRRLTLDVIGTLPAPEDVRTFLADTSPEKRDRTIDRLLDHPMHAALWATRYLDITGCDVGALEGPGELRAQRARQWHDWFRTRFAANTPFDQIVHGVLCATSRGSDDARAWAQREADEMLALKAGRDTGYAAKPGLDLFWRRLVNGEPSPVEPLAERVAAAFLGVRIECAQCHKHPFDRWTVADYRAFANTVADVQFGLSPDGLAATAALLDERRQAGPKGALPPIPRLREVYVSERSARRLAEPETGRPLAPRGLGGPELAVSGDVRERLFDWLVAAENPYFARSFANRVWAVYFGAGLVEPVTGFSITNPPSNAALLDALADDFRDHGYDIRRLERPILRSRAYERSSEAVEGNHDDRGNFARALPRPLMAEALVDSLNAALGVPGEFGPDAPQGARAIEIATNRVTSPDLARVFRILGRPERAAVCDCERPKAPALPQTLFLMTDEALLARLAAGRVRRLAASDRSDAEAAEELFRAALSRLPSADEARAALDHLQGRRDRAQGLAGVLWALINSREFVLNH
jgi:hypothetical protein